MNSKIAGLWAKGATRLYDAVLKGIESNRDVQRKDDGANKRISLVIVLTDGIDTNSQPKYEQLINYIDSQQGSLPVIITVGYGNVDEKKLTDIAAKTGGMYYKGSPSTIRQI